MSKTLYLPDHVAQKMNEEKSLNKAYVDTKELVLDPSLLEKSLLEVWIRAAVQGRSMGLHRSIFWISV